MNGTRLPHDPIFRITLSSTGAQAGRRVDYVDEWRGRISRFFIQAEFFHHTSVSLGSLANPVHAGTADRARTSGGGPALLHRDLLGVLNFPRFAVLYAVSSHLILSPSDCVSIALNVRGMMAFEATESMQLLNDS